MTVPTDTITELLWDVAERVVRPRWRALDDGEIAEKTPGDPVTIADRESEIEITAALQRLVPGVLVVGEEATATDPSLPEQLCEVSHAFVVDPVDGTKNFVEGRPEYAVMVGEIRDGVAYRGWIIHPELGHTYTAERGAGLLRDGERVRRDAPDLTALKGATNHRRLLGEPGEGVEIGPTFYSCGVDYPHLATGGFDFLLYRNMKPWDHVPGIVMIREVGGVARTVDGTEFEGIPGTPGPLVIAASEEAWEAGRHSLA